MELTLYCEKKNQLQQITINKYEDLPVLIEVYFGIKPEKQLIQCDGVFINQNAKFKSGDMLVVSEIEPITDKLEENIDTIQEMAQISHTLLYLRAECNDIVFKIIIDTGAQTSVMAEYMAKLLNLNIDTRTKGIAKGVGTSKIFGTVYNCNIKLTDHVVPTNFRVIECPDQYVVILGLDFLYNQQCNINFVDRTITINNKVQKILNEIEVQNLEVPYNCKKEDIKKLFTEMINKLNTEKKQYTLELLKKIICNIIKNPTQDKYRTVNAESKDIKQAIDESADFIPFMKKIGFVVTENGKKLKFIENVDILEVVKGSCCA